MKTSDFPMEGLEFFIAMSEVTILIIFSIY